MTGNQGHPATAARRPLGTVAVEVGLLLVLAVLLVQSLTLSDAARRFPLLVLSVTLLLLLLDLAVQLVPGLRDRLPFLNRGLVEAPAEYTAQAHAAEEETAPTHRPVNEWTVVGIVVALGVSMYLFGYVITGPLFVAGISIWRRVPVRVWVGTSVGLILLNTVLYEFANLR